MFLKKCYCVVGQIKALRLLDKVIFLLNFETIFSISAQQKLLTVSHQWVKGLQSAVPHSPFGDQVTFHLVLTKAKSDHSQRAQNQIQGYNVFLGITSGYSNLLYLFTSRTGPNSETDAVCFCFCFFFKPYVYSREF